MNKTWLWTVPFVVLSSGSAFADVVPQDVYACNRLTVGSPCDNGSGVCQESTCSRLDYSKWDRDASASPPSTSYSCVKCVPKGKDTGTTTATVTTTETTVTTVVATDPNTGVATTTTTGEATAPNTGVATTTTTGAATAPNTGVTTTTTTGAATAPNTGASTGVATGQATGPTANVATSTTSDTKTEDKDESKESSGCSVGGGARVIAPWLLAGVFAACVSLLRRRSRRP